MAAPLLNDDETYGWAYAPPGNLPGEPAVPIPDEPPGLEIPANRATRLPSGVVAYRETVGHHNRMQQLDQQAAAAKMARDQAAQDARMLDQMMRVAHSTKDIEIARRSIDFMAGQKELNAGVPMYIVAARHPLMFGGSLTAALKTAPTPQFTPREVQVGDTKLFETAPNRFAFPPASQTPKPEFNPREVQVGGRPMVEIAPNRFQQVRQPTAPKQGTLTPVESAILRGIDKEADEKRKAMERLKPTSKQYVDLGNDLAGIMRRRNKILIDAENRGVSPTNAPTAVTPKAAGPTGRINKVPANKSELVVGDLYDIKGKVWRWTGNNFEEVQ